MSYQILIFVIFFFINVEFILSVKKCKKVIFEKNKVKKFVKKADYPLKSLGRLSKRNYYLVKYDSINITL